MHELSDECACRVFQARIGGQEECDRVYEDGKWHVGMEWKCNVNDINASSSLLEAPESRWSEIISSQNTLL